MENYEINFKLEVFEGPLDLLLHLISKNKIDILDIPIAQILSQYLDYLKQMEQMDLEITSDFIVMSAHLILIKSKLLLPSPKDEEEEDPRAELVNMLLEYQKYKEISGYFADKELAGRSSYVKIPEVIVSDEEYNVSHEVSDLYRAFTNMLGKKRDKMPPPISEFTAIVGREAVSITSRVSFILHLFLTNRRLSYNKLFENDTNRASLVATFLAVLELCKTNKVLIQGDFDNMEIVLADDED